ncbi:MAG: PLP-dependent aminotransferase family protein [Chloroflexi bacterium]|nr:PLP-dependent aminotransferase family protein [Chloroflexota bacterium]
MTTTFSYSGRFSKDSVETQTAHPAHAKYDFGTAYPPPETAPLDGLVEGLIEGLKREGRDLVYYPDSNGNLALREFTAQKLEADRGFSVDPEDVFLCAGSGEANYCLIQALTDPGSTVVTERFVYSGTLGQLRKAQCNIVGAPIDDSGLIPEALDELFTSLTADGNKPRLLYTIPEHQNPTGSTLPTARRKQIVDICHRHGIPIIEDDCYVDLRFAGETQESFRAMDDSGMVSHVASYSKLLLPGLRLGYFVASKEVRERAIGFRSSSAANHFTSLAVEGFLKNHIQEHKDNLAAALHSKRDAMVSSFGEHFGGTGAKLSQPEGGCYTWLEMPQGADMTGLRDRAFKAGVGYQAGSIFAPNGDGDNYARLCFAYESPEKNREGMALLAQILDDNGMLHAAPAG